KFSYGIRFETANNPRSPWDTFGNNTTGGAATPSDKNSSGIYLGQAYLNWHPVDWYEMTVGRMPMPLYVTPLVWDSDINPEGAFEKFKYTTGNFDWFADFGQFDYQNPSATTDELSGDTFLLAWQAGGVLHLNRNASFKVAPVVYTYTGSGTASGINNPYVGQGSAGANIGVPGGSNVTGYNEEGINNLLVLEIPAEFDYKFTNGITGALQARFFGDFAWNLQGNDRARAAYGANPSAFPGMGHPVYGQDHAYQIGFGIGSAGPVYGPTQGLVYGSTSKRNTWEARCYWQRVEQYALDVNLMDSDFMEGRANLQGLYAAFAYSFTDAIIGTFRYGYANQINSRLGTGGNNLDLPGLNPIKYYNLVQCDLTWRF
ncbi:MAG TPA: putative porin, partial [Verrucomicrobiae bacterium]